MKRDEPAAVREVRRLRRRARTLGGLGGVLSLAYLATRGSHITSYGLFLMTVAVLVGFAALGMLKTMHAKTFALECPETIGLIAEMFIWDVGKGVETNHAAAVAITALLPQMTAEHCHAMTGRQARLLYRRIDRPTVWRDRDLVLALAQSLSRTRDWRALPYVEAFLRRPPTDYPEAGALTEALRACLPILQEEKARQSGREALLRPAPAEDAETLMRPAPAKETEEAVLLRASVEEHMVE